MMVSSGRRDRPEEPEEGTDMYIKLVKNYGWVLETELALENKQAAAITFRAEPKQVVLGDYVEVRDAMGTRIGHVKTAEYFERWDGPAYVVVGIELR